MLPADSCGYSVGFSPTSLLASVKEGHRLSEFILSHPIVKKVSAFAVAGAKDGGAGITLHCFQGFY